MVAQGNTTDLVAFGDRGLWTSARRRILPPAYCVNATNLRKSTSGALTLRKGYTDQTGTELSSKNIESLHEFIQADESVEMIVAWDGGIANDIDDPAGNDISGSVTDTSGTWFFQNFNDKCIGFQSGQKLIVYTGTGNFATVSEAAGTAPTGGVGCAAYGHIFQVGSDGSTLYYSDLLDETTWTGGTAGSIDFNKIWTDGQDTIMAVRGFNGYLVVWGKRHVIFLTEDPSSAALGLNPNNAYVTDVIAGTGCISQHTVQLVGESDILFCSDRGVQSLRRLIQEKSNPIETLTSKVEQDIITDIQNETAADIRSCYSPVEGLYLLTFPTRGTTWALEMRYPYQDELTAGVRVPVFKWTLAPYSWAYRANGDLLLGVTNKVGKYTAYTDDGSNIEWLWTSPWLDLGEELANRLKILKRIGIIVETGWGGEILVRWAVDFNPAGDSTTFSTSATAGGSEWGVAKWNEDEFSGSLTLQEFKRPGRQVGQYYRFSLSASTDKELTLQQLEFFYKIGRLA